MAAFPVTYFDTLETPIGTILLTSDGDFVTGIRPHGGTPPDGVRDPATLKEAVRQVRAYFAGERTTFDLPIRQPGTTFQQRVWAELSKIPYGQTISYAELAKRVKKPKAARAVGSANGRNHLGVVVPCHRVIAADGTLGGYGWGLAVKEWLLNHERASQG
jgi:methylated-DNA-[protein]-cysteine S-methyltransferase